LSVAGCAAPATPPPATAAAPEAAVPGPPRPVQPPPFAGGAPARPESTASARTASRLAILDAAWRTVRDQHYDKTLGGVDWSAVLAKYEPLPLAPRASAAFSRVANHM